MMSSNSRSCGPARRQRPSWLRMALGLRGVLVHGLGRGPKSFAEAQRHANDVHRVSSSNASGRLHTERGVTLAL